MALHRDFPPSPYDTIKPEFRWLPEEKQRRSQQAELMPPLVPELRQKVKEFRDNDYAGASGTSKSLLNWWFKELQFQSGQAEPFKYFFAQREALETIIYLYDVVGVKDEIDLMRFDGSRRLSRQMFPENWRRCVVKMATGSGKTKVMSLALAWSYFHKLYEPESAMARNFLVIAPNIIVLDRIYRDFGRLDIFSADPVLPENGYDGRDWQSDFQIRLHKQDDVQVQRRTGNIFLTNIHRVYLGNAIQPSPDDENTMNYFLGPKPTGKTNESKVDLGMIVRDLDELMVINDEAHHVHDKRLAWFQSIEDINNHMVQKGSALSLQLDVTATPKHSNGSIFVQTVSDYPLVEAISQNVVKHPVLPDKASQKKLSEKKSVKYTEQYADYINLGVIEWRKAYEEHKKRGKKAILFVMTDDTKNCDEVAKYLELHNMDLEGKVLVIHTKNNGDISEAQTGRAKEELDQLRGEAQNIDSCDSPYTAIVSVLVLKEGWDVRNVTTIVGLRPYTAKSNILPEQTLGRGLRKMYPGLHKEQVSVIGTDAFMALVEEIQAEGVELEYRPMSFGAPQAFSQLDIFVDEGNPDKEIGALEIEIPLLTPRSYRKYKNLTDLDVESLAFHPLQYRQFSEEEQREIVFVDPSTDEESHTTTMNEASLADANSVVGWFTRAIMKELRLFSEYDVLYGKVKQFIRDLLFAQPVDLDLRNTLRNLSDPDNTKTVVETFKEAINKLTVEDKGSAEINGWIKLGETRPFVMDKKSYLKPKKSLFNLIVGDSGFELKFASFLEACGDVASYGKNYQKVGFKLDYVNTNRGGYISNYIPDFLVKLRDGLVVVVETKGREDLDVPMKMGRLRQWCEDVNALQSDVVFDFVYVNEEGFNQYPPKSFAGLLNAFREYKET